MQQQRRAARQSTHAHSSLLQQQPSKRWALLGRASSEKLGNGKRGMGLWQASTRRCRLLRQAWPRRWWRCRRRLPQQGRSAKRRRRTLQRHAAKPLLCAESLLQPGSRKLLRLQRCREPVLLLLLIPAHRLAIESQPAQLTHLLMLLQRYPLLCILNHRLPQLLQLSSRGRKRRCLPMRRQLQLQPCLGHCLLRRHQLHQLLLAH